MESSGRPINWLSEFLCFLWSGGSTKTVLDFCQDPFGEIKPRELRIQTNLKKFTPTFFMITVVE